jgi:hypothetical protein
MVVVFLALGSCAACPRSSHTPRLSEREVLTIANHAIEASGTDLSQFHAPEAHYDYVSKDCTWSVFYEGIKPDFGNVWLVVVNDNTRAARVDRGL